MDKQFDHGSKHHGIPDEILDGIFSEKDKGQNIKKENIECTCASNSSKQFREKKPSQMPDFMGKKSN